MEGIEHVKTRLPVIGAIIGSAMMLAKCDSDFSITLVPESLRSVATDAATVVMQAALLFTGVALWCWIVSLVGSRWFVRLFLLAFLGVVFATPLGVLGVAAVSVSAAWFMHHCDERFLLTWRVAGGRIGMTLPSRFVGTVGDEEVVLLQGFLDGFGVTVCQHSVQDDFGGMHYLRIQIDGGGRLPRGRANLQDLALAEGTVANAALVERSDPLISSGSLHAGKICWHQDWESAEPVCKRIQRAVTIAKVLVDSREASA